MTDIALKRIEQLVNDLLRLDEVNLEKLASLHGKRIAIQINDFDSKVYLFLTRQGIELQSYSNATANVTIKAPALTYLQLAMSNRRNHTVTPGDMEITGDVGLAQQFQSILKDLEIDWEEYISQWTGDYMAHKTGNLVRGIREYIKETSQMIGMDISEYLRYEKRQLPDQSEVNEFVTAVDIIRNDVERLQQRLTRVDKQLFSGSS